MDRTRKPFSLIAATVAVIVFSSWSLWTGTGWAWRPASKVTAKEKTPYRPQWVSVVKKGKLFKYKRKEFSSPRIHGDAIFVGSDGGFFYAMKKKNGRKLWRFKTSGPVNSAPAFSEDATTVYFGDDDGILYALNLPDGKPRWKTALNSEILTAPAVRGNRLYVSTIAGKTHALDSGDGRILWTNEHPMDGTKMSIQGNTPPILDPGGNLLFVGFADGVLRCLSASSGKLVWEKSFQRNGRGFSDIDGAPLVDGDRLYVAGFDTGLFALAMRSGQTLWTQPVGSGVGMLARGDVLYVSGSDAKLYAYQKKDGTKIWEKKIGEGALTAPVAYDDLVMVGLSDETMNFVDATDGHIIARRFARKGVFSDPILDQNRIYYLSNGGRLYSLKILR